MVDSCRECKQCRLDNEQYCHTGCVWTYNCKFKYGVENGNDSYGGYCKNIVVSKDFCLKIPANLDLAAATPLLCAGITVYSPMMQFGLKPEMKAAVVGLGGLGHMGVKIMKAMGCHTTVISRGTGKKVDACTNLKADAFIDSTNDEEMKAAAGSLDFMICTVSSVFSVQTYMDLLACDGKMILVGVPGNTCEVQGPSLIHQRRILTGSLIGGVKETQDMLDFCGKHDIVCDVEMVTADEIETAYDRTVASDVKYRFVIDTSTI